MDVQNIILVSPTEINAVSKPDKLLMLIFNILINLTTGSSTHMWLRVMQHKKIKTLLCVNYKHVKLKKGTCTQTFGHFTGTL